MEQNLAQELREALNKGMVSFSYEKANGEWREARGTRNPQGLGYVGGTLPKGTGTEKVGVIAYWDLDAEGWRSCKEDKIIAINSTMAVEQYITETEDQEIQEGLATL